MEEGERAREERGRERGHVRGEPGREGGREPGRACRDGKREGGPVRREEGVLNKLDLKLPAASRRQGRRNLGGWAAAGAALAGGGRVPQGVASGRTRMTQSPGAAPAHPFPPPSRAWLCLREHQPRPRSRGCWGPRAAGGPAAGPGSQRGAPGPASSACCRPGPAAEATPAAAAAAAAARGWRGAGRGPSAARETAAGAPGRAEKERSRRYLGAARSGLRWVARTA